MSPGDGGYQAIKTEFVDNGDLDAGYELIRKEVFARMVLVNWDGGEVPPFTQDCPEQGTIFRITTTKEMPIDTFTFQALPPEVVTTGNEGVSLYIKYKLINKGGKVLKDVFVSSWFDPDIGDAGDDLVGCDSIENIFYCYNDGPDANYGTNVPAVGLKLYEGPIVPSAGDTAFVDGNVVLDYKNLEMGSFFKYINPYGPDNFTESYNVMSGLDKNGDPYQAPGGVYTKYMHAGDPVTGIGDMDDYASDRRMMASFGPFDFRPNDTQQVVLKLAVGQDTDYLNAITKLLEILSDSSGLPTDAADNGSPNLPKEFKLCQNYPNPFNPSTSIEYSVPTKSHVTLTIYNILGQRVSRLVDETKSAGTYTAVWNGTDDADEPVASGIYFYRLTNDDNTSSRKMILLK